ncbi:MAG: YitT family protein [Oscillospiraceae bacterium]
MDKRKESFSNLNKKEFAIDMVYMIVGSFLISFAIYIFTAANHIAPGGSTGLSTILNFVIKKIPIGTINMLLNIPLFIMGYIFLGKMYMIKTTVSLIALTIFMDYVVPLVPVYQGDKIVAAIFGGAIMGAGMGLTLVRGGSSGGMDIVNKIIALKFPHMSLGKICMITDSMIVIVSAVVFGNIESALYSIITIYICTTVLDLVVYGLNESKMIYIISDKAQEISKEIIAQIKRGATILEGKGAYTNSTKPIVLCAVRKNEYFKAKKIIYGIDEKAFVMLTNANEVVGQGFAAYEEK